MPELVSIIVITDGCLAATEDYALLEANFAFVSRLTRDGFHEDELLPDAIMLRDLWNYIAQVNGGGHESFVSRSKWAKETNDHLELCLDKIGAFDCLGLFRKFRAFVDSTPEAREEMRRRAGFNWKDDDDVDPMINEIDCLFYRLQDRENLYSLSSTYLRHHPQIEVIRESDWATRIDAITETNPLRAERLGEVQNREHQRKRQYERKLEVCRLLSEIVGQRIDATRGLFVTAQTDVGEVDAVVHKTDRSQDVAYVEIDGKAKLFRYPSTELLAEVALTNIED